MNVLLVLPVVVPLLSAALSLLAWRRRGVQRGLAIVGTATLLAAGVALFVAVRAGGIAATQAGGWPAPHGITFVADLFSAIMVVLAGLTGLGVAVYSLATLDPDRESFGYYPLLHVLLMGVCGAFLTGDLFNLYVWFEVMLMASFVLLALGGERGQLQGAIKYVTLNLVASAVFLAAVGILYGVTGTLNLADLARRLNGTTPPGLATALGMLFVIAFGIKAAVFPLFFWLPASYHTPPVAVSAVFAGLLTKVGVYALIRAFTLLFRQDPAFTHTLLLAVAGLTMLTGVLGAATQHEFRRVLSFHIISQIGYMLMGLALSALTADPALAVFALAGSVFYVMHHILVKTNLFLVSGIAHRLNGSYELEELGGLYAARPGLAVLFLIPAFSLAGLPPLSGFFAKLALVRAGLAMGQYLIVGVALVVSLLTLFSMTKIWAAAFWKPAAPGFEPSAARTPWTLWLPPVAFAGATVLVGLFAGPLFELATEAAEQLLHPQAYLDVVLGEERGQ